MRWRTRPWPNRQDGPIGWVEEFGCGPAQQFAGSAASHVGKDLIESQDMAPRVENADASAGCFEEPAIIGIGRGKTFAEEAAGNGPAGQAVAHQYDRCHPAKPK